ncbi:DNA endonuclease SmrA [Kushneria marisflavi]|uniref:DNA endonuclease SmrA n=1 Tax=Kushneria marisflavi TaxID=157779 RepID=A0A240UKQ3_9GAMM|nr:DNA endonuclease SmrA [Kushneria marisflavi]ART61695.1 DNA endonuclease SmrA [Kushneria marisflavi]RKD86711.1 DNA-nicking Smr family endonuclease [Kushneria marisflavi]
MNANQRDEQLFFHEMADVIPLNKGRNRADAGNTGARPPSEAQLARRASAQDGEQESNFLSDEFVDLLPVNDPIEFRRDGIQTGVIEKLRHGGYQVDSQLNLLKRPVAECRRELFRFIREAHQHELRCVMIVHGRGKSDESHANVVRSYVGKWLEQFDEVQAYATAQPRHGGLGATYVMLKKSYRARQRNRELHQRRRAP